MSRLLKKSSGDSFACSLMYLNGRKHKSEDEEEQTKGARLNSKLRQPDTSQEKPLFLSSLRSPGPSVPLELNTNGMKVPYTINRYLRDYQREGIRFIYNNYAQSRGCILGDDMGLGKTVQVIGFLAAVLHKTGTWEDIENNRPHFLLTQVPTSQRKPSKVFLIVAPLSVLYNWKDELETWGHFQCVVVHGLRKDEELARVRRGRSEIALTTYETLRLCLEQFNGIEWSAVIVDEAHKIKNPNSQITQAMKELRCEVRVGLTGTILQNNLEELWCVMDWAVPGCLGSLRHFKNEFSDPIEQGQKHSATKRTLATGRKAVRALAKKISHWFLRRTKALIKDQLPKKDDRVVYCSLTEFQQTVYQTVLNCEDVTLLLRSHEKCDCGNGLTRRRCCYKVNSKGVEIKYLYFSYLAILRKVANHVALLRSTTGTSKKQEKYVKAICDEVFLKFPDYVERCKQESFEAMSDPIYSGKMMVLQKLLKHYRRDKVLLFSLSTKLLDVLESYCMAEGLEYSRLDGTTKARERLTIVKEFNSCPHTNLCLVSTMAGGLGLNFVGANVVILFDPTWNPANDLQAIDRAYRIGQCRDVTVLRLISLGTVEEVIYLRQVYKQQLQCSVMGRESARRYFEAVQGAVDQKGELFGIRNLFRLQTQGTCLTRRILEREGRVEVGVMTSSTHTGEEEEEEGRKRDGVRNTSFLRDPVFPIPRSLSLSLAAHSSLHSHVKPGKRRPGPPDVPPATPELAGRGLKDKAAVPGIPKGVLDFSSEDEEDSAAGRRAPESRALEGAAAGSASNPPGRLSLLQHGFSQLLQRAGPGPGAGRGDSSLSEEDSGGGSDPEEEEEHPEERPVRKTGIAATVVDSSRTTGSPAMGRSRTDGSRKRGELISMSEESEDLSGERPDFKERMKKNGKREAAGGGRDDEDSGSSPGKSKTTPPRGLQFGYCSDESEDFDMEARTRSRVSAPHPQRGGGVTRGGSSSSRAQRKSWTPRRAEDIEAFTSSEEDQPPVRRGRPAPPQNGSRAADRQTAGPMAGRQSERQTAGPMAGRQSERQTAGPTAGRHSERQTAGPTAGRHSERQTAGPMAGRQSERQTAGPTAGRQSERQTAGPTAGRQSERQTAVSCAGLNAQVRPAIEAAPTGTIDLVLGDVQGVAYTHSNQRVVGGSKAEERISRAALKQVFQRRVYSQMPANQLLDSQESPPSSPPSPDVRPEGGGRPTVDHPVTFTTKTAHHTPDTTYLIGQTPAAIRRQQLEEMAAECGSPSVRHFAQEVLRSTSAQRLAQLRRFYVSRGDPQLTAAVHERFPEPDAARARPNRAAGPPPRSPSGTTTTSSTPRARSKRQRQRAPAEPQARAASEPSGGSPDGEAEQQEEPAHHGGKRRRGKRKSVTSSYEQAAPGGLGPEEAAAALDQTSGVTVVGSSSPSESPTPARPSPTAQEAGRGVPPSPRPSEASVGQGGASTPTHRVLLTELIGDTSILDDLFRPSPRTAQRRGSPRTPPAPHTLRTSKHPKPPAEPSASTTTDNLTRSALSNTPPPFTQPSRRPPEGSKGSRKDFWDILCEGNEESINRLTDLSEVQRMCESAARPASRAAEERQSAGLWKTNDKFLWKK